MTDLFQYDKEAEVNTLRELLDQAERQAHRAEKLLLEERESHERVLIKLHQNYAVRINNLKGEIGRLDRVVEAHLNRVITKGRRPHDR